MSEPKDIKFQEPKLVFDNLYGTNTKKLGNPTNWESQEKYPRFVADINGDGRSDIIGFGHDWMALNLAASDGRFDTSGICPGNAFTYNGDDWKSQNITPRLMGDINGDGKADIVGFGKDGVYAMTSYGNHFAPKYKALDNYSVAHTWSSQDQVPRFLADVNGDGWADIVGFGAHQVHVSFAIPTTRGATQVQFTQPQHVLANFGITQGWSSQEQHPRFMADINGDGKSDIVGFGAGNVFVAFSTGSGFEQPQAFSEYFTSNEGYSWNDLDQNGKSLYARSVADINGDGRADIVGFYAWGTIVMTSNGRSFNPPYIANYEFSYGSWGMPDAQPRMLADVNGDRKADIVGFKADGVHVSLVQSISPSALDVQACERFSPNIEVKCMEKVYNRAIKQLDESRMNAEAIQNAKKELIQSYNEYANSVEHLQNSGTHFIDDTIRAKEAKFIKTMDTAGVVVAESSRLVEVARVAEANRVAGIQAAARAAEAARVKAAADAAKAKADAEAKAAEELKKAKEAEEEELRKLEEDLSMDDSLYNQHVQDCQATQTSASQDNQQIEATISVTGKIIYDGEYVNG